MVSKKKLQQKLFFLFVNFGFLNQAIITNTRNHEQTRAFLKENNNYVEVSAANPEQNAGKITEKKNNKLRNILDLLKKSNLSEKDLEYIGGFFDNDKPQQGSTHNSNNNNLIVTISKKENEGNIDNYTVNIQYYYPYLTDRDENIDRDQDIVEKMEILTDDPIKKWREENGDIEQYRPSTGKEITEQQKEYLILSSAEQDNLPKKIVENIHNNLQKLPISYELKVTATKDTSKISEEQKMESFITIGIGVGITALCVLCSTLFHLLPSDEDKHKKQKFNHQSPEENEEIENVLGIKSQKTNTMIEIDTNKEDKKLPAFYYTRCFTKETQNQCRSILDLSSMIANLSTTRGFRGAFVGPPGVGKSELISRVTNLIARAYQVLYRDQIVFLKKASGTTFNKKLYVGSDDIAINNTFHEVIKALREGHCVILEIDEGSHMFKKRTAEQPNPTNVEAIIAYLDLLAKEFNGRFSTVIAFNPTDYANPQQNIDEATARRFEMVYIEMEANQETARYIVENTCYEIAAQRKEEQEKQKGQNLGLEQEIQQFINTDFKEEGLQQVTNYFKNNSSSQNKKKVTPSLYSDAMKRFFAGLVKTFEEIHIYIEEYLAASKEEQDTVLQCLYKIQQLTNVNGNIEPEEYKKKTALVKNLVVDQQKKTGSFKKVLDRLFLYVKCNQDLSEIQAFCKKLQKAYLLKDTKFVTYVDKQELARITRQAIASAFHQPWALEYSGRDTEMVEEVNS